MHTSGSLALTAVAGAALAGVATAQDLVIPSGITFYTNGGTLIVDSFTIEAGATLAVQGTTPLVVQASDRIVIYGLLQANGVDAADVATLNTGNIPEPGGAGVGGGGSGGSSSVLTGMSTPQGLDGLPPLQFFVPPSAVGGRGGESGYGVGPKNNRRPGGGAGGTLALGDPSQIGPGAIYGLVPEDGWDGSPSATGAVTGLMPPQGGLAQSTFFVDGDPTNDYWGKRLDRATGLIIVGEAQFPVAGFGGGAGGDAVPSSVFPHPNWFPYTDEKGGPGGGGGGLVKLETTRFVIGPQGKIRVNGGFGATGENTIGTDHMGAGGGGGSGGWLIISAREFDLRHAPLLAIKARGGRGAEGASGYGSINAGGEGGPGVIQFHTPDGTQAAILLPPGAQLDDMTVPNPYVLLPMQ